MTEIVYVILSLLIIYLLYIVGKNNRHDYGMNFFIWIVYALFATFYMIALEENNCCFNLFNIYSNIEYAEIIRIFTAFCLIVILGMGLYFNWSKK